MELARFESDPWIRPVLKLNVDNIISRIDANCKGRLDRYCNCKKNPSKLSY